MESLDDSDDSDPDESIDYIDGTGTSVRKVNFRILVFITFNAKTFPTSGFTLFCLFRLKSRSDQFVKLK